MLITGIIQFCQNTYSSKLILLGLIMQRKSIFIFLSNTGGKEITKKVLDVWLSGKTQREELTIKDFERLIELGTFNEEGKVKSDL